MSAVWLQAVWLLCPWGRDLGRGRQEHGRGRGVGPVFPKIPSFTSMGVVDKVMLRVMVITGRGGDVHGTPGCRGLGQCLCRAERSRGCEGDPIRVRRGSALGKFPNLTERWTCPSSRPPSPAPSSYIGDCEISVELQKIQAGVNGIQVSGARWCCPHSCPGGGGGGGGQGREKQAHPGAGCKRGW